MKLSTFQLPSLQRATASSHVWDVIAIALILGFIIFCAHTSAALIEPLAKLDLEPISLDPGNLPAYAARTTFRMLAALLLSLLFTFTYSTLAAKSRRAELLLVPLLDILQSVPILGFISITVVFFMSLAPGKVLGAEFAAIFAIFTSQAWNMAFSFYQSLRTVPHDLDEAAASMRLTPWMKFWRLEVPFAMPGLVWNMMMSMSGGWFFVVASEAISVGDTTITLPGVGSYIALAIEKRDLGAIFYAIGAMAVVILLYDQLLFRPLVAWADRFRAEQQTGAEPPTSWVITMLRRSRISQSAGRALDEFWRGTYKLSLVVSKSQARTTSVSPLNEATKNVLWLLLVALLVGYTIWDLVQFIAPSIDLKEVLYATELAGFTLIRVIVLIALASFIWVPIGIYVGLRPNLTKVVQPIAQFLAAFPANLLFPLAVVTIVGLNLSPDIWLSPLMILGTQWYILFNVIAGAAVMPREFLDAGASFHVSGWRWWRYAVKS